MGKVFRFDNFELDCAAFELRRGEALVDVEPLVLDLLIKLLEQPGVVLSRDVLVASVWKGRIVSDSTIATAVKWARRVLGDNGFEQRYLRTVRGRGIQFVVPVETIPAAESAEPDQLKVDTRPALYIHAFEAVNEPSLDAMARALRARAGSILARIPLLQIATPFPEADRLMDPRELRARFAISHVLDARLQSDAGKLTADASLTDTRSGLQIWAQQFEVEAGPGDQEILLHKMIRRIEPRLMQSMVEASQRPGGQGEFRSHLLKGIALLALKGWSRATFVEATKAIEKSVELAPGFALSHAYLALVKALGHRVGLLRDDDRVVPTAIAAAERALDLENQDSTILGLVGCALADVGQVERALPILRKAIEAGPQNGHAKTALGAALMMKQEYKAAAKLLTEGMDGSPADSRLSVWGTALSLAQLAQGELDAALMAATNACKEDDRIYLPRLALAGVHLVRKEQPQAVAALREAIRTKPDLNQREVVSVLGERLGAGVWSIAQALLAPRQ